MNSPESGQWPATWHVTPEPVRATGVVLGLTLLVAVLYLAFGWPAAHAEPHDLPIGLAGTNDAVGQRIPAGFAVTRYDDGEKLRAAIRNRDVYGGLVADDAGLTLLTASGAGPAVAGLLTRIGADVAAHTGHPVPTEDLAPLPPDDPHGAGLAAAALPLTLAGLLPALVLIPAFPRRILVSFIATVAFSMVAAWTVALLLRFAFGAIDQNFAGVTAGLALGVAAMSLAVLGLGTLFGRIGLGLGAGVAVLLGNPLSGLAGAPELLPRGWGTFGQVLPQGANATLLRSTAYFGGAGATTAMIVLICWTLLGLLLIGIAGLRRRA